MTTAIRTRSIGVPSGVLAMLLFVIVEAMFFSGLISAFAIIKSGNLVWPPSGQPRLPITSTALNSAFLFASGFLLFLTHRSLRKTVRKTLLFTIIATAMGAFFVIFQGVEWVRLITQGLTLTSSSLGSFFYLIVGMHGLHAVIALGVLIMLIQRLRKAADNDAEAELSLEHRNFFHTAAVLWYFVVLLWPFLYTQVYL